jgi:hypothetical protein
VWVKVPLVSVRGGDCVGGIVPDPAERVPEIVRVGPGVGVAVEDIVKVPDHDSDPTDRDRDGVGYETETVREGVDDGVGVGGTWTVGVAVRSDAERVTVADGELLTVDVGDTDEDPAEAVDDGDAVRADTDRVRDGVI